MTDEDAATLAERFAKYFAAAAQELRRAPYDGEALVQECRTWYREKIEATRLALNGIQTTDDIYRLIKMRLIYAVEICAGVGIGAVTAGAQALQMFSARSPDYGAHLTPKDMEAAITAWSRKGRPTAREAARAARTTKWDVLRALVKKAGLPLSEDEDLRREYGEWRRDLGGMQPRRK